MHILHLFRLWLIRDSWQNLCDTELQLKETGPLPTRVHDRQPTGEMRARTVGADLLQTVFLSG